jgi:hypothetical protein
MDDSYGSTVREAMKHSMEEPMTFKTYTRIERRRSWWERHNAEVGFLAWSFVVAAIGTELFLVYGLWPR